MLCVSRAAGVEGWSPHVSDSHPGRLCCARLSSPWRPQPCPPLAPGWKTIAPLPPNASTSQRILGHLQHHCKYRVLFMFSSLFPTFSEQNTLSRQVLLNRVKFEWLNPLEQTTYINKCFMSLRTMGQHSSSPGFICSPLGWRNSVWLSCSVLLPPKSDWVQSKRLTALATEGGDEQRAGCSQALPLFP